MGRLTEFFGAIEDGIGCDNKPYFAYLDIENPELRAWIATARRVRKKYSHQKAGELFP